jgi:hypothetical protein
MRWEGIISEWLVGAIGFGGVCEEPLLHSSLFLSLYIIFTFCLFSSALCSACDLGGEKSFHAQEFSGKISFKLSKNFNLVQILTPTNVSIWRRKMQYLPLTSYNPKSAANRSEDLSEKGEIRENFLCAPQYYRLHSMTQPQHPDSLLSTTSTLSSPPTLSLSSPPTLVLSSLHLSQHKKDKLYEMLISQNPTFTLDQDGNYVSTLRLPDHVIESILFPKKYVRGEEE